MQPVTWMITSIDPEKIRLLMRWLPAKQWESIGEIVIVTDTAQNALDIHRAQRDVRPAWNVHIRTELREKIMLNSIDPPHPLRIYFRDLLGVKLMLPITSYAPFMFTDDDFIVTRDPGELFVGWPWGSHSGLDGYTKTAKDLEALETLCSAVGEDIPLREFNRSRTDAGAWFFPRINKQNYVDCLRAYFDSDHIRRVCNDKGTAPGGHTQRFRKLDQRFLSGYLITEGGFPLRSPNYRALAEKKPPRSVPNATLVHYCASGVKQLYMDLFWKNVPDES